MHILYIVQYFNLPEEPGGGRAYHFALQWARKGHRVTVLTGVLNHKTGTVPERYRGRLFTREELEGIELIRCASTAGIRRSIFARILNFLTFSLLSSWAGLFLAARPDVVYASSTPLTIGLPGWLASLRWGRPFFFEVRDLWPESAVVAGVLRRPLLIRLARWMELFLYRRARLIVAVTRGIGAGIRASGIPEERILFVPNGVDDLLADLPEEALEGPRKPEGGPFTCLYLGALGIWNGNETILDAAEILRDREGIEFLFVGDGGHRPAMERRVRERDLSSVRFLGALPKREAVDRLLRADLCLICTWDHPFHRMVLANKIFDYLASARPVVAAAEGEMADLLAESGAGISVSPGDGPGMAGAIERLRSLPEAERRAMGRRGRAYALAHFRRRDLADRVEAALAEVLEDERR